ncbi:MAG: NAD(P)H-binding protein [Armatimonadetes bacterium]|nr:NAD(P)H-binding protein [Armatimonadota bacterium]
MFLVTGAAGNVGERVVKQLAETGRPQRALVRTAEQAVVTEALGVETLVGDLTRPADRQAALAGVESVIACHTAVHSSGFDEPLFVDGQATEALIEEAVAAGVRHYVMLSHVAVEQESGSGWLAGLRGAERELRSQEGMAYTILRLTPLMTELVRLPLTGNPGKSHSLLVFGNGRNRIAPVSPRDAANLAVRCAVRHEALDELLAVAGPETYTWDEMAGLYSRAYDVPVASWKLPRFFLALARRIVSIFNVPAAERLAAFELLFSGDLVADPAVVAGRFGLELEDLVTYLRR